LVDCGYGLFKGVTAETMFIILKKGTQEPENTLLLATYDSENKTISERLPINQKEYSNLISHWNYRFIINLSPQEQTLLTHFRDLDYLSSYVSISRGIETGSNVDYISTSPKQNGNWIPLLRGRDISPYQASHQTYLNYNRDLLTKPGRNDLLSIPKVILQQNASRPIAYFDEGNFLVLNSTTFLADAPVELLKSFCVFLNSQLINWFFNTVITNNASLTVNILPNNLSIIPVPLDFDAKHFAELCSLLQNLRLDIMENEKYERTFKTWHEVIVEAAVCEAYLPSVFQMNKTRGILHDLESYDQISNPTLSSKKFEMLLSKAKDILKHEILLPVRDGT
jgi:hypothetical protein